MTNHNKTYIVDIDQTICYNQNGDYENSVPDMKRIEKINRLYDRGNTIIYWTARGMNRFNGDVRRVYETFYELTKEQLNSWGVKYTDFKLGKPSYDYIIDDKAINDKEFFKDV